MITMLQLFKGSSEALRDFFTSRPQDHHSDHDTNPHELSRNRRGVKRNTIHPNTKTITLDRQRILVIQHNLHRHDSIPQSPPLRFTIQECLYTIQLMERTIPGRRVSERAVPVYKPLAEGRVRSKWAGQPNLGDIFQTVAKICVCGTGVGGGQRVAVQAALVKASIVNSEYKLTITICGDHLDNEEGRTVDYLNKVWKICQRLRELYPQGLRRKGKDISYLNILRYRRCEAELQELIVAHTIEKIKRRVLKWWNKFRTVAQELVLDGATRRDKITNITVDFIRLLVRYMRLLHGYLHRYKATPVPAAIYPTIRLILSEMHRDMGEFLNDRFEWETGHPERREITDYSLLTMIDNSLVKKGFTHDGFVFSKYLRKVLEPISLAGTLVVMTSDSRWEEGLGADVMFKVVQPGQRKMGEETVKLAGLEHDRDMFARVLLNEPVYNGITTATIANTKTDYKEKVEKAWRRVSEFAVRSSNTRPPPESQTLHPECELAERYCKLSTFDYSKCQSREELDRVEHTPYMFIAMSKPPCRGCRTWFLAYSQRVKAAESNLSQQRQRRRSLSSSPRRKLQPLYLTCAEGGGSILEETTDYNWIAPVLGGGVDVRVQEWMANQLRMQAVNMAGLTSSLCDGNHV